ncbi:MAG: periplasmic binding protein/LacI transcriptional regulator [Bacteroidetes bacterium]|nr:periplasmic binding protein/LacI transcriptional regulator [Bacteroidota bacterium]
MKDCFIRGSSILAFLCATSVGLQAQSKLRIAVIPMGTTHVFWKSVEVGAKMAGKELGVEIIWKGPIKENDRGQQISIVEQFVNAGVSGIALAPLDHAALMRPVSSAMQKQIPVVIFDSPLDGEAGKDFVSFVGTNNKYGGTVGGMHLSKLLGGRGKAVLLRFAVGAASSMAREEGFLEAIANEKGIEVIVKNRFAGATAGEAKTASMNLLDKLKDADGIFCPNESTTFGMLLALRQGNLAGKKKFVGFDTSPPLVEALRNGEIDALVAQDPTRIGFEAVKAVVSHIKGEKVNVRIDTGVQLITRENLSDPKIKKLLGTP